MKKLSAFIIIALTLASVSCNKNEIHNTDTKIGISDVTFFPTLQLKGDQYMAVPLNGTFTDPGVEAKEGTSAIKYTTTGSVNTSTTGVYQLTYSAVNKDGFSASTSRWVAVYSTDASAEANDFSGTYLRAATGVNSFWTKLAPGVYKVDNPGGAASGSTLSIIVFNPTGLTIHAPSQKSNDGNTSSTASETYTLSPAPAKYSWVFNNPGYLASTRTFTKQ
jgi:hypothetical protein